LTALARSARNGATRWQGNGIGTSTATTLTGLAVVANLPEPGSVLVKHSYNGDANGDGLIDADDYFRIDSGFLNPPANPAYAQGNFNYDDVIDADDYFLIDSAFLGQGAPVSASAVSATATQPAAAVSAALGEATESRRAAKAPLTQRVVENITNMTRRRKGARVR
jgi:hypothetical protein